MQTIASGLQRVAPSPKAASALSALLAYGCDRDGPRVAIPRAEVQLVVRFASPARGELDIHVLGVGRKVHRKLLRRGERALSARLRLGASEAVLGEPASAVAGRVVPLGDLWGDPAARRLSERLSAARDPVVEAAILQAAIAERVAVAGGRRASLQLALEAAERLTRANVNVVAADLRVSERHLRRVFHEVVGVSPKAFAMLARFHRALRAAREETHPGWASVAAFAGYYDQAHLIAEFRMIANTTPRALLEELRDHPWLG